MLQQRQKVLAKAPSTHDPKRQTTLKVSRERVSFTDMKIEIGISGWQ
jgi:hypothetical protein